MAGDKPLPPYTMDDLGSDAKRCAPAASRNVLPIGDVLEDWLPTRGLVLETSSGTGEHALAFARRFSGLDWQPSDIDPGALASIAAWREEGPSNLLEPIELDVSVREWPVASADAILSVNMAHISPWEATLGLLDGASRILSSGGVLIFYGPWLADDIERAPSNLAFDRSLKARDPAWGIRSVDALEEAAAARGLPLAGRRAMPANNMMLCLIRK